MSAQLATSLIKWYEQNARALPWRKNRDPYRIWISEVMLQQTTVAAVIPFYERMLARFPKLADLATADLSDVYTMWTGLGYYSRARNLHKAAIELHQLGQFPKTAEQLITLPGFGPYTSRAVASLAFDEAVGVLDGNVIRVLSRVYGLAIEFWKTQGRAQLQSLADQLAQEAPSHLVNQGLMELGATVCTPQNPTCFLCPWREQCVANRKGLVDKLPLKKPRKQFETWIWKPVVLTKNGKVLLVMNHTAPFLKKHWIFPGSFTKAKSKPKSYSTKHTITHHEIFIQLDPKNKLMKTEMSLLKKDQQWVHTKDLSKVNPSILLQKVLQQSALSVSRPPAKARKKVTSSKMNSSKT